MENAKKFDLEERTFNFAKKVREFIKKIPKNIMVYEDISQLIRSSGSIGANYIEANEALSKKDFYHRIKISRKEAKESRFWLRLLDLKDYFDLEKEKQLLIQEAIELMKIFGSILEKDVKKEF